MRKLLHGLAPVAITLIAFSGPVTPVEAAGANMSLIIKPLKLQTRQDVKRAHCRVRWHCHRRGRRRYCHRCG